MKKEKRVPTSRLSRLTTVGGIIAKVAGNLVLDSAKQWSKGESSSIKELWIQPKNIEHLADKLSELRGAAMKVGQLLSMDSGDFLPPELSQLLDKLRANGDPMPHKQLLGVLQQEWGNDWLDGFSHFELKPFASASIGQVHIAYRDDGKKLAVKVQYAGVAKAIKSDVDNVAVLLKVSGLLPSHINIDDLLEEAKLQLLNEADYKKEAAFISLYRDTLSGEYFLLPVVDKKLSTGAILVMDFIDGVPIDTILEQPQMIRNNVVAQLIGLFFEELFNYRLMQTDPNFANYLFQTETQRIALLDFGATRVIPDNISKGYQALIIAGVDNDKSAMVDAARTIGFFADDIGGKYLEQVFAIFTLACEPLSFEGDYDFAASGLAERIKDKGISIHNQKDQWHTPPVDAIFIHRKLAGLYLLAAKLRAQVNVKALFSAYAAGDNASLDEKI